VWSARNNLLCSVDNCFHPLCWWFDSENGNGKRNSDVVDKGKDAHSMILMFHVFGVVLFITAVGCFVLSLVLHAVILWNPPLPNKKKSYVCLFLIQ